jgi:gas vesicle protein
MRGVFSFVVGVILGSLVGASIAILLAPMSGEQLRFEVQDRAKTFADEVQTAAQVRRAELEQQLADLRAPRRSGDIQVQ